MTRPEIERLAVLETEVASLKANMREMLAKQDEILALRHKGVGAFWVASSLLGTGIIGAIVSTWNWFLHG